MPTKTQPSPLGWIGFGEIAGWLHTLTLVQRLLMDHVNLFNKCGCFTSVLFVHWYQWSLNNLDK